MTILRALLKLTLSVPAAMLAGGLASALLAPSTQAAPSPFRPAWIDQYRVRTGGARTGELPNSSFLDPGRSAQDEVADQENLTALIMDSGKAVEWNQQYQDMQRGYELRERAGLINDQQRAAHEGAIRDFSNNVKTELEKYQVSQAEKRAKILASRHETVSKAVAPAILAAGVYIGRPMRARLHEDTYLSLRTNFRDKFGSIELSSPLGQGQFEFRPKASESRVYGVGQAVNFEHAMDFNRIADFSQERYQLSFSREVPVIDLRSQVLYGLGSSTVAGSLSKRLTDNLSCVVDSTHWLRPFDASHSDEQKVRLRYDIRF